jgi:hypothetical protein
VTKRSTSGLLCLACLLAAILAGCGGDGPPSAEEYEAAVVETRDRADAAMAQIQEAKTPDEFLDRLDEAGEQIESAALELNDDESPERFEDENTRLVRHLRKLAAALHGTAGEARTLGFEKLLTGAEGLNFESWDAVNAVLADLREQGIEVEPLERH